MKLVTVAEMQAIEREANEKGWTYAQMMEKAGQGLAEMVESFYGYEERRSVVGLVGSGNNGGDTLIALEALARAGWQARAYMVVQRAPGKGYELQRRLTAAFGELVSVEEDQDFHILDAWLQDSTVLLDGVLGTGVRLPLKPEIGRVLARVRDTITDREDRPSIVAVDCPSGVDCDSGQAAEEAISADLTVCMAAVKVGLLKFPAYGLLGDIETVDIGLPDGLQAWSAAQREIVTDETVRAILPERRADSHKGTFGTVCVAAGSLNYTGAALLSARAAHRIGAGLVQVAVPAPVHTALAGHFPEATWVLLPSEAGGIAERAAGELRKRLDRVTALLLGPGLGVEEPTAGFVRSLVEGRDAGSRRGVGFLPGTLGPVGEESQPLPPMVIDADGLKLLARVPDWWKRLPSESVLTPHPGEMAILTGLTVDEIQADRVETARRFAQEWGQVVVLKGAFTVIASPNGRSGIIPVATSALAHAGTGDVLAGMIAGLRAQGVPGVEAALAAAWLHAQSGLLAAEQIGHEAAVLAGDLLDVLPEVLSWVW